MTGKLYGVGVATRRPGTAYAKSPKNYKRGRCGGSAWRNPRAKHCLPDRLRCMGRNQGKRTACCAYANDKGQKAAETKIMKKGHSFLEDCLEQGKKVAFLTLGDPTVYSTYLICT